MGEKRQALAVLQQASMTNANHQGINAEYGRLALEFDQVSLAQKLLEQAEDPTNPDWRIISARGTVLAKQGQLPRGHPALRARPDHGAGPALGAEQPGARPCHGGRGRQGGAAAPARGRRRAGGQEARVNQNLALVLGLQGKYDEAKLTAARGLPADKAAANVDYMRSIVKLDAKPLATGSLPAPRTSRRRKRDQVQP